MGPHESSLPPEMIIENPIALGVREQWFPIDPLVRQMNPCVPALGILARLQHCVGGKAQLKESGAQTRNEQRLGAILDLGTHVRVHHRESQSTTRRRTGQHRGGNRDVFDSEDNKWQSCKQSAARGRSLSEPRQTGDIRKTEPHDDNSLMIRGKIATSITAFFCISLIGEHILHLYDSSHRLCLPVRTVGGDQQPPPLGPHPAPAPRPPPHQTASAALRWGCGSGVCARRRGETAASRPRGAGRDVLNGDRGPGPR